MSIIINVTTEGKDLTAWVSELGQRSRFIFRVFFSSHYENIFFKDVENGRWIEEDLGYTELAQKVGKLICKELELPSIHVPKLLNWHFEKINDQDFCFGFTTFMMGDQVAYEIYDAKKKYLYTIFELGEDNWEMLGNTPYIMGKTDPLFIAQVINTLTAYSENPE